MFNKIILIITITLLFLGCSSDTKQKEDFQKEPKEIKVISNAVNTNVETKKEQNKDGGQFYYSLNNKKESNLDKYNSQTNKVRTTIDAYLHIKNPYERVKITMMIKRLSKDYVIKCSPCHDDYANGVIGPSLLDKNTTFIYQRIMDFKNGKRKNVLMKELVSQIDNERLKKIAKEIAEFNKQIRKMRESR